MPKRLPSGKTKRGTKTARTHVPQRQTPPVARAESGEAAPAPSTAPTPARRPTAPARQSLLSNVRRPAAKAGPALVTDYSYVTADLKRIGAVSAAALVILVALSFVIR